MSLKIITGPVAEPVSLQEAKLHLRIIADVSDVAANPEDAYVTALIVAARETAEHLTGRALMPQTLELAMSGFPRVDCTGLQDTEIRYYADRITLPRPPLVSVTSVKYLDESGVQQTLDPSAYVLDDHSEPACLTPAYGLSWPANRCQPNAVLVRYDAGYADAATVPTLIKSWMLLCIGMLYENRESVVTGISVSSLPSVDRLLDRYRLWNI